MQDIVVTVRAAGDSPRLRFMLDWLLGERLGLRYWLNPEDGNTNYTVSYGNTGPGITIPDAGLLWEKGSAPTRPEAATSGPLYTLYSDNDGYSLPFDLFSGIFYLLSRYEEYNRSSPDRHGRYRPEESVLYPVLERPVIDEWVELFRRICEQAWNRTIPKKPFSVALTYDIDIAWAYRHKGLLRTAGGTMAALAAGRIKEVAQRIQVGRGLATDPFDAFAVMAKLHETTGARPHYFVLSALQATAFDKNIPPRHPAMQALIRRLANEGAIGMHPSYFTKDNPAKLGEEHRMLAALSGQAITSSRQHFIRLLLPHTYRMLSAIGITDDYSMGYSTALGFRAGTGNSFLWYDLQEERQTSLRIHPFCFMDTTAVFDLQLSRDAAFDRLRRMGDAVQQSGSRLTTVFHNFSLGTNPAWGDYLAAYSAFVGDYRQYLV